MTYSIRKVVLTDYLSAFAVILTSSLWLSSVLLPDARSLMAHPQWIVFLIVVTAPFLALLLWRLHRVSRLFRSGRPTEARIIRVWKGMRGRRGRGPSEIHFAFEHDGQRIRTCMYTMGWKPVLALKRGQVVEALYDPTHPTRAIIRHLFQA